MNRVRLGNGGATCGNCQEFLGNVPGEEPKNCPKCDRKLIDGDLPFVSMGGSVF